MAPLLTFHTSPHKGSSVQGQELNNSYTGDLVGGLRHGHGTYTYANGYFTYQGEYCKGEKHGQGKLTSKDGSIYIGQFSRDEILGTGTKHFANGSVYKGTFHNGDLQGHGVLQLANGEVYEGEFVKNMYQGRGIYTYCNGNVYEGDFTRHRMTGQGVMTYASGDRYEGIWVDAQRHGHGSCSFSNGNTYEGDWDADVFSGEGSLWVARQAVTYRGLFVAGCPSEVPTKVNVLWYQEAPDPRAAKAVAAKKKAGELPPVMPVTLGQPITTEIRFAAQFEASPPPASEPQALSAAYPAAVAAGAADKKTGRSSSPIPPTSPPVLVVPEPASPGQIWATATMEYGRGVVATLHGGLPQPLPPGKSVTALVVPVADAGGGVLLRLVLLEVHVEAALPLARSHCGTEPLFGVQLVLEAGEAVLPPLCLGALPQDAEAVVALGGVGALLVSSWGVRPGFVQLALPEPAAATKASKAKVPATK